MLFGGFGERSDRRRQCLRRLRRYRTAANSCSTSSQCYDFPQCSGGAPCRRRSEGWGEEPRRGLHHETWRSAGVAAAFGDTPEPAKKILRFSGSTKPDTLFVWSFRPLTVPQNFKKKCIWFRFCFVFAPKTKPDTLFCAPLTAAP